MESNSLKDFWYELPEERIAKFPLPQRDSSNLLVYQNQSIQHRGFRELPDILPAQSLLVFNDTKVIPARLHFTKETGAVIEVFLLQPEYPTTLVAQAMVASSPVQWQCAIGNLKRWKGEVLSLSHRDITLSVKLINREKGMVELSWTPMHMTFSEVLTTMGEIPLPPYLNRDAVEADKETYQTVYSKAAGAVAAPTAGLHFTEAVLNRLKEKGIHPDFLTLHVSAGTFQPIKTDNVLDHTMHAEQVIITKSNIEKLLDSNKTFAVGTTALRTLESLYWFGVKTLSTGIQDFHITQQDAYSLPQEVSRKDALQQVLKVLTDSGKDKLIGDTSIYIRPGYRLRMINGLITNFHQPGSTLIVLIAALLGSSWRKVYEEALANNYRFLSYGDSSLLIP